VVDKLRLNARANRRNGGGAAKQARRSSTRMVGKYADPRRSISLNESLMRYQDAHPRQHPLLRSQDIE
jgi:hypothetical protein